MIKVKNKPYTDFQELENAVLEAEYNRDSESVFVYSFGDGTYSIWNDGQEQDVGLSKEDVQYYLDGGAI